jgi:hypothetical protein
MRDTLVDNDHHFSVNLEMVAKYGTTTAPLPSLATGGGDAGASDKILEAEAIRGYEQHDGLEGAWRADAWQWTPRSRR